MDNHSLSRGPFTIEQEKARSLVSRHLHIANQVVFLSGLTGSSKTMLAPILSPSTVWKSRELSTSRFGTRIT